MAENAFGFKPIIGNFWKSTFTLTEYFETSPAAAKAGNSNNDQFEPAGNSWLTFAAKDWVPIVLTNVALLCGTFAVVIDNASTQFASLKLLQTGRIT